MITIKFLPAIKILSNLAISVSCSLFFLSVNGASSQAFAAIVTSAGLPDFSDLVEKSGPAVVNIRTTEKVSVSQASAGAEDEQMRELLRRYFGKPGQGVPGIPALPKPKQKTPPQDDDEEVPRGVGSGFIISDDGYVLTNAHVVDGADEVYVKLTDQREFKAKIVGLDSRTDVAVLKVEGSNLPKVTIGNSAKARVGEWVIAIGSPFDLDNTVTAGIISAKARETGDFLPLLQTDVAVNPGNSGGPLINMRGEVVGINSQIYSRSGGYMGISFAIPIDDAIRVAGQLKMNGRVTRGRMGIYLADVSKEVAHSLGLAKESGSLVSRIEKDGPAEKAGLIEGDIVLKFNSVTIEKSTELRRLAAATTPGTKVDLLIWRKGVTKEIPIILAELVTAKISPEAEKNQLPEPVKNSLGLVVKELTDAQKKELTLASGVVIASAEGAAARAGLRAGDIVLSVNNVDVTEASVFYALSAKADEKKALVLLVRRADNTQYVAIHKAKK